MKCEACHSNDATVQVKQVADGMVKEVCLCVECAEKSGLKSPAAMADFLFGTGGSSLEESKSVALKSCPVCHMRGTDFKTSSRLGCEHCYETFAEDLEPMLESMHRSHKHIGKTSSRAQVRAQIMVLQGRLNQTVAAQEFEDAAGIRDEIRALEAKSLAGNP